MLLLSVTVKHWASVTFQKHNVRWFLLRGFADLVRVCSLHIISRNYPNKFLLIRMQKTKTCPKWNITARAT